MVRISELGYKTDPLHAAAQLSGRSRMHSLDEPVSGEEGSEETLTLGEMLAGRADDPAAAAGAGWIGHNWLKSWTR